MTFCGFSRRVPDVSGDDLKRRVSERANNHPSGGDGIVVSDGRGMVANERVDADCRPHGDYGWWQLKRPAAISMDEGVLDCLFGNIRTTATTCSGVAVRGNWY